MIKTLTLRFIKTFMAWLVLLFSTAKMIKAQVPVPRPDHVVVLVMENHGYEDIIGNASAPYINLLAQENALMNASYGLTHPSQPNYIMMFSGSNQGVTNNNVPAGIPWTTPNLGSSLLQSGFTFKAFSDGLPSVGYNGTSSGAYMRKHAPWTNWQGSSINGIPANMHRPFTDFPSNFNQLPTVSYVVPDQNHDMHDGTIAQGDAWVENNLSAYVTWAKTNNSLFILTFDEDDGNNLNHIVTIFAGEMVETGSYNTYCDHYDLLRTIEEMYELPHAGNSSTANTITDIWKSNQSTTVTDIKEEFYVCISPNPVTSAAKAEIKGVNDFSGSSFIIYDLLGNEIKNLSSEMRLNKGVFDFDRVGIRKGIYFYSFTYSKNKTYTGKIVFE